MPYLIGNFAIVAAALIVLVHGSPGRPLKHPPLDNGQKDRPEAEWERELLELRSGAYPDVYFDDHGKYLLREYHPEVDSYEEVLPFGEEPHLPYYGVVATREPVYYDGYYDPYRHSPEEDTIDSLTHFLGSPELNSRTEDHRSSGEINFGNVWELDAFRQMGRVANVPEYLIDSVDPVADENLLELMVKIAGNPEKWRIIHSAIERLDQADESYERKDIEKRSSNPYVKRKKLKKKRKRKHFGWDREYLPKEVPRYRAGEKIRHQPELSRESSYEYDSQPPKSAAYASVVFTNNENKNFERWKVNYQPVQPEDIEGGVLKDYKHPQMPTRSVSYAKKKLKMKAKEDDLRRWQFLKFENSKARSDDEGGKNKSGWPQPKEHKENWPHFAYHRVTSSPGVQQRDAGAQPRHRSAYVAVSVVPTNSTVASESRAQTKQEKIKDSHSELLLRQRKHEQKEEKTHSYE